MVVVFARNTDSPPLIKHAAAASGVWVPVADPATAYMRCRSLTDSSKGVMEYLEDLLRFQDFVDIQSHSIRHGHWQKKEFDLRKSQ